MVAAIEKGYPQQEIADAAFRYQQSIESGEEVIVGVNKYKIDEPPPEILYIDDTPEKEQRAKLEKLRQRRDNDSVKQKLEALNKATRTSDNLMPYIIEAARNYATLGEIIDSMKKEFGEYVEPPMF
jgi:methylmalonyl-CoA mutase N-terminal domain/subunit